MSRPPIIVPDLQTEETTAPVASTPSEPASEPGHVDLLEHELDAVPAPTPAPTTSGDAVLEQEAADVVDQGVDVATRLQSLRPDSDPAVAQGVDGAAYLWGQRAAGVAAARPTARPSPATNQSATLLQRVRTLSDDETPEAITLRQRLAQPTALGDRVQQIQDQAADLAYTMNDTPPMPGPTHYL